MDYESMMTKLREAASHYRDDGEPGAFRAGCAMVFAAMSGVDESHWTVQKFIHDIREPDEPFYVERLDVKTELIGREIEFNFENEDYPSAYWVGGRFLNVHKSYSRYEREFYTSRGLEGKDRFGIMLPASGWYETDMIYWVERRVEPDHRYEPDFTNELVRMTYCHHYPNPNLSYRENRYWPDGLSDIFIRDVKLCEANKDSEWEYD